jgi:hypothetical protein
VLSRIASPCGTLIFLSRGLAPKPFPCRRRCRDRPGGTGEHRLGFGGNAAICLQCVPYFEVFIPRGELESSGEGRAGSRPGHRAAGPGAADKFNYRDYRCNPRPRPFYILVLTRPQVRLRISFVFTRLSRIVSAADALVQHWLAVRAQPLKQ